VSLTMYGITNCDTIKKARSWLEEQRIPYAFHDYKKQGVTKAQLEAWCDALGWEVVLNRAGPTFRKLSDQEKADLDQAKATALMINGMSMIKRPILEGKGVLLVGFKPDVWQVKLN
jgi:arsenate reductase (glutaredoxin)